MTLQPGASQTVSFPLTQKNLQYWNSTNNAWATATGSYAVEVGDSDANLPLSGTLAVTAAQLGQPVTITSPGPKEGLAGTTVSTTVSAADSGSGQTPTFTATGLPAGTAISSAGAITGTPTTAGTSTVTVTAQDSTGAQVWQPQSSGSLVNPQSGACLDDTGNSTIPGTQVEIWTCTGGANQVWRLP